MFDIFNFHWDVINNNHLKTAFNGPMVGYYWLENHYYFPISLFGDLEVQEKKSKKIWRC